jgi:hypothetical protein
MAMTQRSCTSGLSFLSQPTAPNPLDKESVQRFLKQELKKKNISIADLTQMIPCSLEALDHLNELYVEGVSKFDQELMQAKSLPEKGRRLVNKKLVNI